MLLQQYPIFLIVLSHQVKGEKHCQHSTSVFYLFFTPPTRLSIRGGTVVQRVSRVRSHWRFWRSSWSGRIGGVATFTSGHLFRCDYFRHLCTCFATVNTLVGISVVLGDTNPVGVPDYTMSGLAGLHYIWDALS